MHPDTKNVTAQPTPTLLAVISALTGGVDESGDWRDRALCAQTDPDAFFPDKGESTKPAKRVCRSCEVRAECLQDALDRNERFGIWGGLSERQRRALTTQATRRYCPRHHLELSGGPVLWHCPAGQLGHGIYAADLQDAADTKAAA